MKKHYKAYINGFTGAKELREKMMECNNATEVETILRKFMEENNVC
jgi:tRNA-dihydrouridine synthase